MIDDFLGAISKLETSVIISVFALIISFANAILTWQGRRLAIEQERRRAPHLGISYIRGYFKKDLEKSKRIYAFCLLINNSTDTNNAIAKSDLLITYTSENNFQTIMRIAACESISENFLTGNDQRLVIPTAISAHSSQFGWIIYVAPWQILKDKDIVSYKISLVDAHEHDFEVVPILISEYINAPVV